MKKTDYFTLVLSLASTPVMAVPPLPAKTPVKLQSVADTFPPPATSPGMGWPGLPLGTATWYRHLGLPVIAQTTPNDRLFAFPARVNLVGVFITAANDEGVMTNGAGYSTTGSPSNPTVPVVTEAAPLGPNFLGNGLNSLAFGSVLTTPSVERLQISSNGIVACQTFSNNSGNIYREGIATNSGMLSLGAAGVTLPMTARQPGVIDDDCRNIAAREQWSTPIPQIVNRFRFPGSTGLPMNPLPLSTNWFVASTIGTPLGGSWWLTQGAVARLGSPSISEWGVVAAHCIDNAATPFKRPQIRIEDPSLNQFIVMRQGTPCGPNPIGGGSAAHFGVVNSSLMALNHRGASGNNRDVIAWHMTNMRIFPNSGIINQPSLWCRQALFPPSYITHGGGVVPAPGIPLHFFNSFYALHVTDDPTNTNISKVIFGVNLVPASTPQKRAIYACDISGGVVGPLTLIATNVPGTTPVIPYTLGTDEIATFGTPAGTSGHFFSVSRVGEVFFKATLGATVSGPVTTPAQRQVLVVASPTTGYALQVWAQSGMTSFFSLGGGGPYVCTNFTLTQPDQGTYSRGQGIANLLNTSGVQSPNVIFRAHVGANQAIILAD